MSKIRVAIVEDDEDIRLSLKKVIEKAEELVCACACESGEEALLLIPKENCDVVLMDINMPDMSGIECVEQLKPKCPSTQFMMCTVYEEDEKIFNALMAGASGYIMKKTPPDELIQAIHDIHAGGAPMSPAIARRVVQMFRDPKPMLTDEASGLTTREKEMLHLLAKGLRYKEIAEQLFISLDTVKRHAHNIYEKLHVQSRTDAINKAFRR